MSLQIWSVSQHKASVRGKGVSGGGQGEWECRGKSEGQRARSTGPVAFREKLVPTSSWSKAGRDKKKECESKSEGGIFANAGPPRSSDATREEWKNAKEI